MCRISGGYFFFPVDISMFSTGFSFRGKGYSPIFLRIYIHEFSLEFINTRIIDSRHCEMYISMMDVVRLSVVMEIQPFKVK